MRGRNFDGAARVLESAVSRQPENPVLRIVLGEASAMSGNRREGFFQVKSAGKVEEVGSKSLQAVFDMVLIAGSLGDRALHSEAVEWYRAQGWRFDSEDLPWLQALWSFLIRNWQDPSLDAPLSRLDFPEVDVAFFWAALERGADPAVVRERSQAIFDNVETGEVARCFEAFILLKQGSYGAAEKTAISATESIDLKARESLRFAVWVSVAEWVVNQSRLARGLAPLSFEGDRPRARLPLAMWENPS